jgi:hypothetical protein
MTMKGMKGHEGFLIVFLHSLHVLHGEILPVQSARNELKKCYSSSPAKLPVC